MNFRIRNRNGQTATTGLTQPRTRSQTLRIVAGFLILAGALIPVGLELHCSNVRHWFVEHPATVAVSVGLLLALGASVTLEPAVRRVQERAWQHSAVIMLRRFAYAADEATQAIAHDLFERSHVPYDYALEELAASCPAELREASRVAFEQSKLVAQAADAAALPVSQSRYSAWTPAIYEQVMRLDGFAQTLYGLPFVVEGASRSDKLQTVLDSTIETTNKNFETFIEFNHDLKLRADEELPGSA